MKAFFSGALTAAPITAVILFLVLGLQARTDARLERAATRSELHRAEDLADFDRRWATQAVAPAIAAECPDRTERIAELKTKLVTLNAELASVRDQATADAAALAAIVKDIHKEVK